MEKMSHRLAQLNNANDWQLEERRLAHAHSWTRFYAREAEWDANYAKEKELVLEQIRLIGAICVQYNLPSGDPPWMAHMISSYN